MLWQTFKLLESLLLHCLTSLCFQTLSECCKQAQIERYSRHRFPTKSTLFKTCNTIRFHAQGKMAAKRQLVLAEMWQLAVPKPKEKGVL